MKASEVDRFSLTTMFILSGLCFAAGVLPGLVIDALAPVTQSLIDSRMPPQMNVAWMSIIPIAESRSSYNGLLVFVFILVSASLAAYLSHKFASRAWRRGPAWGGGFSGDASKTQYTASSFAQPIRRVFGPLVFDAREEVDMPPPGDLRAAKFVVEMHDLIWDKLYSPLSGLINRAAERLNAFQFLTIRRYLSLVFVMLVVLLLGLAAWS